MSDYRSLMSMGSAITPPRCRRHPILPRLHSRGSHLLAETGKMHIVQDALGHVNIANTARYAQTANPERREAIRLNRSKY